MKLKNLLLFFKRFDVLGWAVIFLASLCFLVFVLTAAYFEITANRAPPIKVFDVQTRNVNKIKVGSEEFLQIPMQWDYSRNCSAYIPISIRGENGEIYQSPPPIYYSKKAVQRFTDLNPSSFEFFVSLPTIARPGRAYVVSDPVYKCDDNKSFINNEITFSYVSEIEIVK